MYKIVFREDAEKQFLKLEKEIQKRISKTLEKIRFRPYSFVERLVGLPYYKLKVGKFRVLLNIKPEEEVIFIMRVGHRKNIYKEISKLLKYRD